MELSNVRARTEALAAPLSAEDMAAQSMADASPVKWHLAHTTWFFEALVLEPLGVAPVDRRWHTLFNSYYEALGPRHPRPERGLLTRPSVAEIMEWRHQVDRRLAGLDQSGTLELGLHHEQQHQELILTDVKHLLSRNPLLPAYHADAPEPRPMAERPWVEHGGGVVEVGAGPEHFAFDNERPRHREFVHPFRLAGRPVSCGEYREFMDDGGYDRPLLWLSDGWALAREQGWRAPLYWLEGGLRFTLAGVRAIDPAEPVCHLSYYEADAFARWAGKRLPSEAEWEVAAADWGQVWEWTASAYQPYPGFRPLSGAAAEYNGKFMVNQMVLRGASVFTPPGHCRQSYRNFFPPSARWQMTGFRLAEDAR